MPNQVLILNAAIHVQLAVSRSLARHGIAVTFLDIAGDALDPRSRAISRIVRIPYRKEEPGKFLDQALDLIKTGGYDMLIPMSDAGLVVASAYYQAFESLLYVGCPPPEIVRQVLDKGLTLKAAAQCGIEVPVTHAPGSFDSFNAARGDLKFPLIAKPIDKIDERSHRFKMRYLASFDELANEFALDPRFGNRHLLQEFCDGEGVGIETLMHNGEPIALFQHRRIKELPFSGGGSVLAVSERLNPRLAEQSIALLRHLKWEGPAMVEFRYHPLTGRAVLMEINGRYWGTLGLAIGCGIEFPFYEWQLAHGQTPSPPMSYRSGVRFHWLAGDIRRLHGITAQINDIGLALPSGSRELVRLAGDAVRPSLPATWSWSDPKPALMDMTLALRQVARTVKLRVAEMRYLGLSNTATYLRLGTMRRMRIKKQPPPINLSGVKSVLFICHGNIIRSPMAEALLRKYLAGTNNRPSISVTSAGFISEMNRRSDERAALAARDYGVSLEEHRSRHLSRELVDQADAIFIMDYLNQARILTAYPDARRKTFLLGALHYGIHHGPNGEQIGDPMLGDLDDVRRCFRELDSKVRLLAQVLSSPSNT